MLIFFNYFFAARDIFSQLKKNKYGISFDIKLILKQRSALNAETKKKLVKKLEKIIERFPERNCGFQTNIKVLNEIGFFLFQILIIYEILMLKQFLNKSQLLSINFSCRFSHFDNLDVRNSIFICH